MNTVEYLVEIADTEGDATALELLRKIANNPNDMARFRSRRMGRLSVMSITITALRSRPLAMEIQRKDCG